MGNAAPRRPPSAIGQGLTSFGLTVLVELFFLYFTRHNNTLASLTSFPLLLVAGAGIIIYLWRKQRKAQAAGVLLGLVPAVILFFALVSLGA